MADREAVMVQMKKIEQALEEIDKLGFKVMTPAREMLDSYDVLRSWMLLKNPIKEDDQ